MHSSSSSIGVSTLSLMLVSPLPPFFHRYSFSMLSLGRNALCIVISLLVHFKNGPEHLSRGTTKVFLPLMRLLLQCLYSRSFLVPLRFSFYLMSACFQYSQELVSFLFSERSHSFLIWKFYSFCHISFSIYY